MRHRKRGDIEIAQFLADILLNHLSVVVRYFLWHAIISHYAIVNIAGGIYGNVIFAAYDSHGFYMVGMVMRNQDSIYAVDADTLVMKEFLYIPNTDSCINKHGIIILSKVIAVSAASAAERNEFQHLCIYFACKITIKL
jgi:hypothetical protein